LWENIWQGAATQTGGGTSVPEPGSLILIGIGLAGWASSRHRKQTV